MKKFNLLATLFALVIFSASAQSPYSKFGYGLLNDNATATQRQMGGIGYAMNSGRQVNAMNPAAYAAIDTLTFLFDLGVDFTVLKSSEAAIKQGSTTIPASKLTQKGGGLDYITMQVPIGRHMGASLGVIPYSSVGYSFGSKITNGVNAHEGAGGINQLYLGFAGNLFKGFYLGANISYLFGNTVNDVYVYADKDTGTGSTSLFEAVTEVRDWHLQFGAQYSLDFGKANRLTAGLVFSPRKTLLGTAKVVKYDTSADQKPETQQRISLKGNASLPDTWGAGINYRWNNRLMIEGDFTYQPWSKVKMADLKGFDNTKFADRYQFSFGGEFTPKLRGNYFQRIAYRAGAFYNRDYMMVETVNPNGSIQNNNVGEWGVSFGFGLPTLMSKTIINLGFEYRHRQASPNPLLKEDYFNIRLGINFNELWFFQNKIK